MTLTVTETLYTEDGEEEQVVFPAHYEVCYRCRGAGKHVNPSIDGHGISREEFDMDPEFEENYFAGVYDVVCDECNGLRVVAVIDKTLPPELQAKLELLEEQWAADAADRRIAAMERAMGA